MQVAFYGSTPNYAFIFEQLGFDGTTDRIRERQRARDLARYQTVYADCARQVAVAAPGFSQHTLMSTRAVPAPGQK